MSVCTDPAWWINLVEKKPHLIYCTPHTVLSAVLFKCRKLSSGQAGDPSWKCFYLTAVKETKSADNLLSCSSVKKKTFQKTNSVAVWFKKKQLYTWSIPCWWSSLVDITWPKKWTLVTWICEFVWLKICWWGLWDVNESSWKHY